MSDDRRTACYLCGGRCDPTRWTCRNCHRQMLNNLIAAIVDEVKAEAEART